MVFANQVETVSCLPEPFPNRVPENKRLHFPLKFKVTTKGVLNISEDKSHEITGGKKPRVSVGGSKHSEAKFLLKPSMPVKSGKRRQESSLDSQKLKKQKMDLSEDKSHEGSVVQRDKVSTGGNKHPEANGLVKQSMLLNSGKRRPDVSFSQRRKNKKMDGNLKLECSKILEELMNHCLGWVFSRPVDPVELKIPDYFQIIKNPMDLGTIKYKLEGDMYSHAKEFADDVKLTFENAKLYNGPSHKVHHWAGILDANFKKRWKLLEGKQNLANKNDEGANFMHHTGNNGQDTRPVLENNYQVKKPVGLTKGPVRDKFCTSSLISLEKRQKARPEPVQVKPGKIVLNGCTKLGKTAEKEHCNRSASPSADLRSSIDSTEPECHSCVIGTCLCLRSIAPQTSRSELDCKVECTSTSPLNSFGVVHSEEISTPTTNTASFEGSRVDAHMSPRRAQRVATLKARFSETIRKANQAALKENGEKSKLSKMQQERRQMGKERLKVAEKASIKARMEAAKAASRRREENDLKMRRERARMAFDKIEKTVEMDNTASLPGGTGYPDHTVLLRLGLRIRDDFYEEGRRLRIF